MLEKFLEEERQINFMKEAVPGLKEISFEERKGFWRMFKLRVFPKGQLILRSGDSITQIHLLYKGAVTISRGSFQVVKKRQKEEIPGSFSFGLMSKTVNSTQIKVAEAPSWVGLHLVDFENPSKTTQSPYNVEALTKVVSFCVDPNAFWMSLTKESLKLMKDIVRMEEEVASKQKMAVSRSVDLIMNDTWKTKEQNELENDQKNEFLKGFAQKNVVNREVLKTIFSKNSKKPKKSNEIWPAPKKQEESDCFAHKREHLVMKSKLLRGVAPTEAEGGSAFDGRKHSTSKLLRVFLENPGNRKLFKEQMTPAQTQRGSQPNKEEVSISQDLKSLRTGPFSRLEKLFSLNIETKKPIRSYNKAFQKKPDISFSGLRTRPNSAASLSKFLEANIFGPSLKKSFAISQSKVDESSHSMNNHRREPGYSVKTTGGNQTFIHPPVFPSAIKTQRPRSISTFKGSGQEQEKPQRMSRPQSVRLKKTVSMPEIMEYY